MVTQSVPPPSSFKVHCDGWRRIYELDRHPCLHQPRKIQLYELEPEGRSLIRVNFDANSVVNLRILLTHVRLANAPPASKCLAHHVPVCENDLGLTRTSASRPNLYIATPMTLRESFVDVPSVAVLSRYRATPPAAKWPRTPSPRDQGP
jgi:hypothetical protein